MHQDGFPAPSEGILVTHFLTSADVDRARSFYVDVLGGRVVRERDPCMVQLSNSWIVINPGGEPTEDKPGVQLTPPEDASRASSFLNIRVADVHAVYAQWRSRGAQFLTPPVDWGREIRCYMRDPDGYLIEVGQTTGLLQG